MINVGDDAPAFCILGMCPQTLLDPGNQRFDRLASIRTETCCEWLIRQVRRPVNEVGTDCKNRHKADNQIGREGRRPRRYRTLTILGGSQDPPGYFDPRRLRFGVSEKPTREFVIDLRKLLFVNGNVLRLPGRRSRTPPIGADDDDCGDHRQHSKNDP